MIFVGIDPGQDGAIAIIHDSPSQMSRIQFLDMPKRAGKVDKYAISVDCQLLYDFMEGIISRGDGDRCHVTLEQIQFLPQDNKNSNPSRFLADYGAVQATLYLLGLRVQLVRPQSWAATLRKPKGKGASIRYARMLFPEAVLTPRGCREPSDGRAEALLIGEYGRRMHRVGS